MGKPWENKGKDLNKEESNKDPKSKDLSSTSIDEIKSKGNGSKSKRKGKKDGSHRRFKTNDPSWYVANPSIVRDVASLPYAVYNGVNYKQFESVDLNVKVSPDSNMDVKVPGIAVYKYSPWYGTANSTSALNLTMRALYSFVRHANSGKTNYEAPDLMLYIMAMDSIYLLIHEIKRFIRLAYLYVLENRDIPEKIFDVLGIDHVDLVGNIANYRAQLNTRIAKVNSLAVPAHFNIFKRRAVMGSVVLSDEPNRPTQLIIPKADGYFKYDATPTYGGRLVYTSAEVDHNAYNSYNQLKKSGGDAAIYSAKTTINNYFALLDSMLSILLADEDINIMSGDIIKAYGDNLYKLPFIEENEIQDIIHDENLLLQFSNSTVLDLPTASFNRFTSSDANKGIQAGANWVRFSDPNENSGTREVPVICQRNGTLVADCSVTIPNSFFQNKGTVVNSLPLVLLNTHFIDTTNSKDISPENTIEWTRLTMSFVQSAQNASQYMLEAGVEIGLGWLVSQPITTFRVNQTLLSDPQVSKTMAVQWFQFGRRNSQDSKIELPPCQNLTTGRTQNFFITLLVEEGLNYTVANANDASRKYNTMYASKFIEGLSYGPRAYEVGRFQYTNTGVVMYGDMALGKMGEKTALASRHNIAAMHDAALLGLISSPYITTSK